MRKYILIDSFGRYLGIKMTWITEMHQATMFTGQEVLDTMAMAWRQNWSTKPEFYLVVRVSKTYQVGKKKHSLLEEFYDCEPM